MEPHPRLAAINQILVIAILFVNDGTLLPHLDQHGVTVHPIVKHREIVDDVLLNLFYGHFNYYLLSLIFYLNIAAALATAFTNTSTSSKVLYIANEARTVPGMPKRVITGSAQW